MYRVESIPFFLVDSVECMEHIKCFNFFYCSLIVTITDCLRTLNKNLESVFAGYWDEEGKTREVIDPDGWYATGDLGKIDDDGYLQMRFPNIFLSRDVNY